MSIAALNESWDDWKLCLNLQDWWLVSEKNCLVGFTLLVLQCRKVSFVIFLTLFLVQVCSVPAQQKPQPSLLYGFPHRSEVNISKQTKRGFLCFFLPAWNMLQNPWGWTRRSQIQVIEERKNKKCIFFGIKWIPIAKDKNLKAINLIFDVDQSEKCIQLLSIEY